METLLLAEALEYINTWKATTADNPVGICDPIGPTEHLPLVGQIINEIDLCLNDAHFWGDGRMDRGWQSDIKESSLVLCPYRS